MNNNIHMPPPLPKAMPFPQAADSPRPQTAPGPTAAAVAPFGAGGFPPGPRPRRWHQAPRRQRWPIAVRAPPPPQAPRTAPGPRQTHDMGQGPYRAPRLNPCTPRVLLKSA